MVRLKEGKPASVMGIRETTEYVKGFEDWIGGWELLNLTWTSTFLSLDLTRTREVRLDLGNYISCFYLLQTFCKQMEMKFERRKSIISL